MISMLGACLFLDVCFHACRGVVVHMVFFPVEIETKCGCNSVCGHASEFDYYSFIILDACGFGLWELALSLGFPLRL